MLQKVSYKEQIYQYLKEAIIKGDLKPGEIYSEQQFADKLNVSRTPVREAILQLKSEDLVEIYNNRGLGIKPLTEADLEQIIQARIAIENYGPPLSPPLSGRRSAKDFKSLESMSGGEL